MIRRNLRRCCKDDQGAAAIELALAAPMLAALLMITVDVSAAFSMKLGLEQGVQRAVEKVMQTTQLVTVQQTIKDEVVLQTGAPADNVTVTFPVFCNGVEMEDEGLDKYGFAKAECEEGEVRRHYIIVEVWDEYEPFFPQLNLGPKNAQDKYVVSAKAGMRTK